MIRRWVAARRIGSTVDIWYHPEYAATALGDYAPGGVFEIRRAGQVVDALIRNGLVDRTHLRRPSPASVSQLSRFHTLRYLESVQDPTTLARIFGLEPTMVDTESLLHASLLATGGTIEAAFETLKARDKVAFNLGGGFHHARADLGAGFCIHNDVAVAIANLRASGFGGRVLIVDLDYHQGDGFIEAFDDDESVYAFSIHGSVWSHVQSRDLQIHLEDTVGDRRYMRCLRSTLRQALQVQRPKLIFYVAGNDVLAGDRLGTFDLTLQGVLERDRLVLDVARLAGIPMVVVLGGAYSRNAWRATYAMIRYALTSYAHVYHQARPSLRERFAAVAADIDPVELQVDGSNDLRLTEEDVSGALFGASRTDRLLDFYSQHGIELVMARYGLVDAMRQRGFVDLRVDLDASDRSHQILRVTGSRGAHIDVLLMELVVQRRWIADPADDDRRIEMLSVEWLLMQDPTRFFNLDRPPLPGQKHPGLGVAIRMQELLVQLCLRLHLHGMIHRPSHFHTAVGSVGDFVFVDPVEEGRTRAIRGLLSESVDEISWAVDAKALVWGDGTAYEWQAGEQVLPLSDGLRAWFEGPEYERAVAAARADAERIGIRIEAEKVQAHTRLRAI